MQYLLWGLMTALNLMTVYLGIVALNTFRRRKAYPKAAPNTRFAVIIPARNEARVIRGLIESLRVQAYPPEKVDIYVAVNNCTDDTEAVARAAGARIIRCSGRVACKGDVLHQAVAQLLPMDYDAYAVFDADNRADPEFFQRINDALAAGETVCRSRLKAANPFDSWVSGNFGLYHALMEWSYSRPHTIAGLSSNLVGTAFVVRREVLEKLGGWNTSTMCEDSEFLMKCAEIGERVAFVPEALSYDEQVTDFRMSMHQRRRWCAGMVQATRNEFKALASAKGPKAKIARDQAMFCIITHTQPLATLLMLVWLPFQPPLMLAATGAGLVLSYLAMVLLGIALCVLGGYPVGRMGAAVAMFPLFTVSWAPLQIMALFAPVREWKAIPHKGEGAQINSCGAHEESISA